MACRWQPGMEITALLSALNSALAEPFALVWSQDSPRFLLVFTVVYAVAVIVAVTDQKNTRPGTQGRGPLYQIHGGLPFSHRRTGAPGADEKCPYPLLAKATASQAISQAGKGGCKAGRGCGWENCHSHRTPDRPGSGICQKSSRRCRGCGALCVTPVCYALCEFLTCKTLINAFVFNRRTQNVCR